MISNNTQSQSNIPELPITTMKFILLIPRLKQFWECETGKWLISFSVPRHKTYRDYVKKDIYVKLTVL